jgi:hypothetical protein
MARTKQEILDQLASNSPRWFREEPIAYALLSMLAALFRTAELTAEAFLALVFRQTSEDEYLDEIGAEIGVERFPGESDDDYRERLIIKARAVTPDAILERINNLIFHYLGEGFDAKLSEPRLRFLDRAFFVDDPRSITLPDDHPKYLFRVILPVWPVRNQARNFFTDHSFTDAGYQGDDDDASRRFLTLEIIKILEEARAAGVASSIEVRDTAQGAMISALFGNFDGILKGLA